MNFCYKEFKSQVQKKWGGVAGWVGGLVGGAWAGVSEFSLL